MPTLLSELVDNMSGNVNSIECNSCTANNRCEECKKLIERLIKNFRRVYQFCNENQNLEDISDEDYAHAQKVWDVFEIKDLGDHHDLYVQSDTLLLEDVFENFKNICLDIYKLDPVCFVSPPGLAWQASFKKTEVRLELLTDYDILLMIKKGLGVEFAKQHIGMLKQIISI